METCLPLFLPPICPDLGLKPTRGTHSVGIVWRVNLTKFSLDLLPKFGLRITQTRPRGSWLAVRVTLCCWFMYVSLMDICFFGVVSRSQHSISVLVSKVTSYNTVLFLILLLSKLLFLLDLCCIYLHCTKLPRGWCSIMLLNILKLRNLNLHCHICQISPSH
jgi:hypothetical protein